MSFRRIGFLFGSLCLAFFLLMTVGIGRSQEVKSPIGVKQVVLIGYDGFGAHYVHWDELPNLKKLRDGGAWTLHMRCVLPSVSAINWASMLMGAGSELHGFRNWGSKTPDLPSRVLTENGLFPDIFYTLRKAYPENPLYAVYSWDGIGFLFDQKAVTENKCSGNRADSIFDYKGHGEMTKEDGTKETITYPNDEDVCATGIGYLAKNPMFTFFYFSEPDSVGHTVGWGTTPYYDTVKKLDVFLGQIIDSIEKSGRMDETVILFVSDHGGTEKGHGGEIMEHMEVPFIVYGHGVRAGEINDVVVNYDVAATIAWILGVEAPQAWRGQPVKAAFEK